MYFLAEKFLHDDEIEEKGPLMLVFDKLSWLPPEGVEDTIELKINRARHHDIVVHEMKDRLSALRSIALQNLKKKLNGKFGGWQQTLFPCIIAN